MSRPLIKICGIKNTLLFKQFQILGINFIGVVFHPASKRCVDIETAKAISLAVQENNLLPVGVFVDQTAEEMEEICTKAQIHIVQLHGDTCRKQHHLLPEHYRRIYVRSVGEDGSVSEDYAQGLSYCHPRRDFLMFDNVNFGSGKPFPWENFSYQGEFTWFLAGGLTAQNVAQAVTKLHPNVVDVSSGVEDHLGEKNMTLIQDFVHSIS